MIHWGVSSSPANTETFIKSLASKAMAVPNYSVTFTVNASGANKVYFALPDRFGAAQFLDVVNSVAGGLTVRASGISYTDAGGLAQGYTLYESTLAGLGSVTLLATWLN
jgi:hypothetical protein